MGGGIAGPIISAVVGQVLKSALSGGGKRQSATPAPVQSPAPAPEPDLSAQQLAGKLPGQAATAPGFLGLSPQMTGLQQRTAIATGGTAGEDPKYRDPAAVEYYRNLALTDLIGPGGDVLGQPTGIERQYAQRLGYDERGGDTTESFLSSLLRG